MKQAVLITILLTYAAFSLAAQSTPGAAVAPAVQATAPASVRPGTVTPVPGPLNRTLNPPAALTNGLIGQARAATSLLGNRSSITPVQMQNINRLDQELARLGSPENRQHLVETLEAAPVAQVQPAPESIAALAATLERVVPSLRLSPAQRRQLAIDLNVALNSGNLSATQAERVIIDARTLLEAHLALNSGGVETLVGDLSAMVAQVQGRLTPAGVTSAPVGTQNRQEQASPPAQVGQSGATQAGQGAGGSVR